METDLRKIAKDLRDGGMGCNCDLDKWEPEASTGHSFVCRIHNAAINARQESWNKRTKERKG